jgi:hypothetical protein
MLAFAAALTADAVVEAGSAQARQRELREETVSDTSRTAPGEPIRNDLYIVDERGRRRLIETTDTTRESLAHGRTRLVETTRTPDVNGRLRVASRYIEETTTAASGTRETVGTLLVPGIDGPLRESRRWEFTEREVTPGVIRWDSTELVRGQNGQWDVVELRSRDTRTVGPGDSLEEETVRRRDASGRLAVSQRAVTRRTEADGRVMEVTDTFGDDPQGFTRSPTPMGLSQRVTRTTTAGADGDRSTIEEIERRNVAAPSDPLRVVRRTVETVRLVGEQTETERRVFERDPNGRMVLISTEREGGQPAGDDASRVR